MESLNFCYWLRGFLELGEPKKLNEEQIKCINEHLDLVLVKKTGLKHGIYQNYGVPFQNQPEGSC